MAVTPTGLLSSPLAALKARIAASAAFMTWTGAEDATEAAAFVFVQAADPDSAERPFAVVYWDPWSVDRTGVASYITAGTLMIRFEADVDAANTAHDDAAYAFLNAVGAVIEDLIEAEDTLRIKRVRMDPRDLVRSPKREHGAGGGDYYQATVAVECG